MKQTRRELLESIKRRSERKVVELACEFMRAPLGEGEAVLAGLEFERWLVESCEECLDGAAPAAVETL